MNNSPGMWIALPQLEASFSRAEDGSRTRDPHLGKVAEIVTLSQAGLVANLGVHPVSSTSTEFVPS